MLPSWLATLHLTSLNLLAKSQGASFSFSITVHRVYYILIWLKKILNLVFVPSITARIEQVIVHHFYHVDVLHLMNSTYSSLPNRSVLTSLHIEMREKTKKRGLKLHTESYCVWVVCISNSYSWISLQIWTN